MTKPRNGRKGIALFVRVQFPTGDRFGPGKAELLSAIDRTGSISEAARSMRMSYRRAWLLVASTNELFGQPVVAAATGGRRGGGAGLTPFGRRVLTRYRRMLARIERAARVDLAALSRWAGRSGP